MRLGDGFFETIRIMEGRPHAWDAHWARIDACTRALQLERPPHMDSDFILRSIYRLLESESRSNARMRLTFYRQGDGAYLPESNRLAFIGELFPLEHNRFEVKSEGLNLGLYRDMFKQPGPLAPYKLLGNHVYIQAAIWASRHHYDDALVCNEDGQLIEATSSNLFVISEGDLLTPPLSSGCVGGVMRMKVINAALRRGIPVYEAKLSEEDLLRASEVFLSNAIQGLAWVGSFGRKRYYHKMSDALIEEVNRMHLETALEKADFS